MLSLMNLIRLDTLASSTWSQPPVEIQELHLDFHLRQSNSECGNLSESSANPSVVPESPLDGVWPGRRCKQLHL